MLQHVIDVCATLIGLAAGVGLATFLIFVVMESAR